MDTLFRHAAGEKTTEKRSRLPWGKKSIPLKTSILSSGKLKHSEEWHQGIDATAGVLHPSDPKLPWGFLRNHTDSYLKKKGKVNQAEADARLTILIQAHDARDIAVAAAAHAMTATGLRALLHADMNVSQGNYFGLKMWLQCLIAANEGNPASVTDLEALWARKLLPFATHGQRAAEWYLVGASRALREMSIPNMTIIPEFSILMNRAITDHSVQLEGYRLKNQWAAAREAVLWMVELAKTSPPVTPPGHLLPEHIFDSQFPVWRMWASWQPRLERITRFAGLPAEALGVLSDLLALEGPDVLTGRGPTLREALIMQYGGEKTYLRYRGMVVQVVDGTKDCLYHMFERAAVAMEQLCSGSLNDTKLQSKLMLFQDLLVARTITSEQLDIFEATLQILPSSSSIDPYTTVRLICARRDALGAEDLAMLRDLSYLLADPQSARLQTLMCQPWLVSGIEKCLQGRRTVLRSLIKDQKPWTDLAIELHGFCLALKACQQVLTLGVNTIRDLAHLPSTETMRTAVQIYEAAKVHQQRFADNSAANAPHTRKDSAQPSPAVSPVEMKMERHALQGVVEAFCIDRLLERGTVDQASQRTMTVMLHIWENLINPAIKTDGRDLAILIVQETTGDHSLRSRCLAELAIGVQFLPPEALAKDLINVINQSSSDMSGAIISLTRNLHGRKATAQCWKDFLYMWLEGQVSTPEDNKCETVLEYSLKTMKAAEWLLFVDNLETLFPSRDGPEKPFPSDSIDRPEPPILHRALRIWRPVVSGYDDTLTRLEAALGDNHDSIRCLLTCPSKAKTLLKILRGLKKARGRPVEKLMQMVVGKLSAKGTNDFEVAECCVELLTANSTSVQACEQIWDAHHGQLNIPATNMADLQDCDDLSNTTAKMPAGANKATQQHYAVPPVVVEAMVAGWVQDEDLEESSKDAIIALSNLLKITVHHISVPRDVLKEATKFWEGIEAEMIKEAERLEAIQKSMKAKNPAGTKAVLRQLGLPDSNPLEEEIAKLPAGVIDLVEKIGESEVEISFPITHMNEMQRNAMGVLKGAKNILVRLYIDFTDQHNPSRFCTHYDNDKDIETISHSPWTSKRDTKGPQDHVCNSPQSAFIWQLNRVLHMQLRDGDINLINLHTRVTKRIQDSAYSCISCGMSHNSDNARLRRSTPCNAFACSMLWYQLPLDVRVPELRNDIFAVDIMLMSVYAAAVSGRPELLPACPIKNLVVVKAILDLLPSLTVISHAVNMSLTLKSYHPDAEKLISWACVHHRGLIATATGICKIPSLPKIHQFVFANASPQNESGYMKTQVPNNAKTQVLFHGTTFDRLPNILAQGLKICSGTALQRTGAAHGKGIYLAEDPATSLTYAPVTMSWRNSGLANTRLVLGCEVSGVSRSVGSTIHVVANEKSVMVRYLFVLPNGTNMPIPGHIVPAMGSAMSALRTGAV